MLPIEVKMCFHCEIYLLNNRFNVMAFILNVLHMFPVVKLHASLKLLTSLAEVKR